MHINRLIWPMQSHWTFNIKMAYKYKIWKFKTYLGNSRGDKCTLTPCADGKHEMAGQENMQRYKIRW